MAKKLNGVLAAKALVKQGKLINAIKTLRDANPGMGLGEAHELVRGYQGIKKETASEIATRLRREKIKTQRAVALNAMEELKQHECGREALDDLRRLFVNRNGFVKLDMANREAFTDVFNALYAGIRDGIV